jgi:hypothetical protein
MNKMIFFLIEEEKKEITEKVIDALCETPDGNYYHHY